MPVHLFPAMHQRHLRAMPPEVQCSNRRRVLAPDHDYIEPEVWVRLMVIVLDLAQLFAFDAEVVRQVVVARSR